MHIFLAKINKYAIILSVIKKESNLYPQIHLILVKNRFKAKRKKYFLG